MARLMALVSAASSLAASGSPALHFYGKSAKFKIYDTANGDPTSIAGVTAYVDTLKEVDEGGQPIRTSGHVFQTFASMYFQAAMPQNGVTLGTAKGDKNMGTASITGVGKVHSENILVTEQGDAGSAHHNWQVAPGDVEWSISVSDWRFCDPCFPGDGSNESTEFMDVGLAFQGVAKYAQLIKEGGVCTGADLDNGAALKFPKTVEVDGLATQMPEGYPAATITGGNKVYLTVRIPTFATQARYSVLITGAARAANSTGNGGTGLHIAVTGAGVASSKWGLLLLLSALLLFLREA